MITGNARIFGDWADERVDEAEHQRDAENGAQPPIVRDTASPTASPPTTRPRSQSGG
mgnify:CR=1 FL=1